MILVYLFSNVCCMLPVPACSQNQYNNTSSKLLGKNLLNVLLQKSPDYKTGQIWLKTWHLLDWDKVSIFHEILLKTSHDRYKVSPVKWDQLFVLLVINGKKCPQMWMLLNIAMILIQKDLNIGNFSCDK